jgi:hypothetical protein
MPDDDERWLPDLRSKPYGCPQISGAWRYLQASHASTKGLFDSLAIVRGLRQEETGKDPRGRLSNDEEDLLRAAIVFTSSGLDACCTRLLRDTVPHLVEGNPLARKTFMDRVNKQLAAVKSIGPYQAVLFSEDPIATRTAIYVDDITRASLQGTGDLKAVRSALGLDQSKIPDSSIDSLGGFFTSRNAIVHDLDYRGPKGSGYARNHRPWEAVLVECSHVVDLISSFIACTAANLRIITKATKS